MKKFIFILFILFFSANISFAQDTIAEFKNNSDIRGLLRYERSGSLVIHSNGWGINYRTGKHLTGYKKRMFEIEFVGMKHSKEIKTANPAYEKSNGFIYGKKNVFFILRSGIGIQKVLNDKPYWGGVQLRCFAYFGASVGILKPVYLYIIKPNSKGNWVIEKYDPDKHSLSDIYGRAPFVNGLGKIKFRSGVYSKFGLNFEYGSYDKNMSILETGIIVDFYNQPIPIMAETHDDFFFFQCI